MSSAGLDKEDEPATEIYVPLVHYAHEKYVARFRDNGDGNTKTTSEVISDTPGGSRNVSTINLSMLLPHYTETDLVPSEVLDISVQATEGRWEVEGQSVKWWYPVPKEGEGEKTYIIEIRRKGGVIKGAAQEPIRGWCDFLCPGEGCNIM